MDGSMNRDGFKRIERKYLFPAGHAEVIRTWLDHACAPDPRFPVSEVSSIYFDTPELFHFHESRNGEFLRTKVRLRWYTDLTAMASEAGVRCYLEVKAKQGALSGKRRTEVTIPASVLVDDPFSSERIGDLAAEVFGLGYRGAGMLLPILLIRYRRLRYLDLESHSNISMDTEIRCSMANDAVVQGSYPVWYDVGVLEIKGMNRDACDLLNPIGSYLTGAPFSKYVVGLQTLTQPLGRRA
jgi:hypothetical protein